jgi:hypothetical protein
MFRKRRPFISSLAVLSLFIASAISVSGQVKLPRPSQKASVMQTIGVTDVTITYSRPGVKGRTIFGDAPKDSYAKGEATLDDSNKRPEGMVIVPYGHIWRTGANEATQFVVTDDVLINGQPLAAGTYSLHTIPAKDEWTIVFNGTANQWGSFSYDPAKDTLRIKAKPEAAATSQEWLTFTIDPVAENSANVNIRWEKVSVPFTVAVKDVAATTIAGLRTAVAAAKPDDFRTPFQAAGYARQNKQSELAQQWAEQALKAADESIKAKATFQNLATRANILLALGRKDEAIAASDKAIAQGKADKADTAAFEKRFADVKAGKQ